VCGKATMIRSVEILDLPRYLTRETRRQHDMGRVGPHAVRLRRFGFTFPKMTVEVQGDGIRIQTGSTSVPSPFSIPFHAAYSESQERWNNDVQQKTNLSDSSQESQSTMRTY
jgi:hypothetical protein